MQPFECRDIQCSEHCIQELDAGQVMVRVDRSHIQRVTLRHGVTAPNPVAQIGFGLLLVALGYFPLLHLIEWLRHGGVFVSFEAWLIPLPIAGFWLIAQALRRGYYLEVEGMTGRKRLAFARRSSRDEIDTFVKAVEQSYGIPVTRGC